MRASRRELPGFADYIHHTNLDKKGEERQKVVRLEARWQLARGFDRIHMDSEREKRTTPGYSALLRVSLAYSTVDQFEAASGVKSLAAIRDMNLANELRTVLELHAVIGNERTTGMGRNGSFEEIDTTDDVRVFAYALRNMFFHGSGTPWGVGVKNKRAIGALDRLSIVLLDAMEREFATWVHSRVGERSGGSHGDDGAE